MNSINWLEWIPYGNAIGWTVLHSVWQIGLVAIALRLILLAVPRKRPNLRYSLLLLSLFVSLIWVGRTFQQEQGKIAATPAITTTNTSNSSEQVAQNHPTTMVNPSEESLKITRLTETQDSAIPLSTNAIKNQFAPYVPMVALAWIIGVLLLSIAMLLGFVQLHRLRTKNIVEIDEDWQYLFKQLKQQMGIFKTVQFAISEKILEPVTFHFFKPVVLVPIGFFNGLSPEQVEVVLLHELAHIRRQDYLVNTLQSIIEILFFYHPAIWWISGKIREEREHCCDDLVLKVRNNPMLYAEALTRLQIFHQPLKFRLAMSLNGKNGAFKKRIFRLFGQYDRPTSFLKSGLLGALLLLALLTQAFIQSDAKTHIETALTTENTDSATEKSDAIAEATTSEYQGQVSSSNTPEKEDFVTQEVTEVLKEAEENAELNTSNDFKALMKAIEENDIETVKALLDKGVDIYGADERGYTPLLLAASLKHEAIAKLLVRRTLEHAGLNPDLAEGSGIQIRDEEGNIKDVLDVYHNVEGHGDYEEDHSYNPYFNHDDRSHYDDECKSLIKAILKEDIAEVKRLIPTMKTDCVDPNPDRKRVEEGVYDYYTSEPRTPLVAAAHVGNIEIAKILLKARADINYSAHGDPSPLMEAADEGHLAFVKYLHSAGADIHIKRRNDGTALTVAAREGQVAVMKYLIEQGADINARAMGESTPLAQAARSGELEAVKFLLAKGADIHANARGEGTPLSLAARSGHPKVVELLLAAGADLESKTMGEGTPLSLAARSGQPKVVELLLSKGANLESNTRGEGTPLSLAARSGHPKVVNLLLSKGADLESNTRGEGTPLSLAARSGNEEVITLLLAKGADLESETRGEGTPLSLAARSGNMKAIKLLLSKGADIESDTRGEGTPLSLAARSGHTRVSQLLLSKGADIEANTRGEGTPLSLAARSGDDNMVKFLLEQGANIESNTTGEGTPLTLAARSGSLDCVKILLEEGADINSGNQLDATPLAIAMRSGHREIARYLVSKGASEDVFSTKGGTTAKSFDKKDLPKDVTIDINSPIGTELKVFLTMKKSHHVKIEVRSLNNRLIEKLSDLTFKGDLTTAWDIPDSKRQGNYLVYITLDDEVWTQKIGDGTDYPWK